MCPGLDLTEFMEGGNKGVAQEELAALSGQRPWVVVSWPGGCFLEASIQPL